MDAPPTPSSLVMHLIRAGIPPTLLCDLLDPQGMKVALAGELVAGDVARARRRRTGACSARSA